MTAIWCPSGERIERANLTRFVRDLRARYGFVGGREDVQLEYGVLHEWSVQHRVEFWRAMAEFAEVIADDLPMSSCIGLDRMAPPDKALGPHWFVGARLNFAENLLRFRDDRVAIVSWNEEGRHQQLTFAEPYDE